MVQNFNKSEQQECIPVGCIPPAAVAVLGGYSLHQAHPPGPGIPPGIPPWEQTPPWDQAPPGSRHPPGPGTPRSLRAVKIV